MSGETPFPVVVGSVRSGTTMFCLMLNAHPDLAMAFESYFPADLWNRRHRYQRPDGFHLSALAEDLLAHPSAHGFRRNWDLRPELVRDRLSGVEPIDYAEAIRRVYALLAEVRGKSRYGEKTAGYLGGLPLLAGLFPEAKFLHLVRDGRDAALSHLAMRWGPADVRDAAAYWASRVRTIRAFGRGLDPGRYLELRYERLVADPEGTLAGVCRFVDLDYDPRMLAYPEEGSRAVWKGARGPSHRNARLAPTPGLRDWRRDMSRADLETFEAVAGSALEAFGYRRAVRTIPLRVRASVALRGVAREARALAWRAPRSGEEAPETSSPGGPIGVESALGDLAPFPFVVGSIRSGTTLLRVMLDSHPELAIPPESYFVSRVLERRRRYQRPEGLDLGLLADDLLLEPRYEHFRSWGVPPELVRSRLAGVAPVGMGEVLRLIYGLYADCRGKARAGDKTPVFVLAIPRLASLLPEGRFVHLVRDGRDVALSVLALSHPDHPATLLAAAEQWSSWVTRGREAGRRLGPGRYLEVRYERLVSDPEPVLREICLFLDLDYRPEMLAYAERIAEAVPAAERWQHESLSRPPTPGLRDWRHEMDREGLALFEAVAGPALEAFGYERAVSRPPLRAELIAGRVRTEAWARRRGARVRRDVKGVAEAARGRLSGRARRP